MTTGTTADDKKADSSDLLSMLKIIEQLYDTSRKMINSHSAAAILLSLAFEVQTLLTKLRAMHQRWTVHLPFKEACTVDFIDWSIRTKKLASVIQSANIRNCLDPSNGAPSTHCLLDIYEQAVEVVDDSLEKADLTDPTQLLSHQAALQKELIDQREKCVDAISRLISAYFTDHQGLNITGLCNLSTIRTSCSNLLSELSDELFQLHEQQVKIFTSKDYERLADRILYEEEYEGQIARREARDIMHNWLNGVPEGKLEECRKAQIEQTKEEIRHTKYGVKLEQYVNLDADFSSQRSEFGRFLFNRRKDITRAELRELILLVYCVFYYQKDALQEASQPVRDSAVPVSVERENLPELPVDFNQRLRDSKAATTRFYHILRRVEPYINNSGTSVPGSTPELCAHYKDWTWYHLKAAFEKLEILPKNSSQSAFATFMNQLFPQRTTGSVSRSLYRNTNLNSSNIVADVVKEFQPVTSLFTSSSLTSSL